MFHARDFDKIDEVLDAPALPPHPTQSDIDAAMARSRELRSRALHDLWMLVTGRAQAGVNQG